MNPFTRFLRQWTNDNTLHQFIEHWDPLEQLIIRVYKNKQATPADETQYNQLRPWLLKSYGKLEPHLKPYWQQSQVGGTKQHGDPFQHLLTHQHAHQFHDNWLALQHLPAAREALNQLLVAHTAD